MVPAPADDTATTDDIPDTVSMIFTVDGVETTFTNVLAYQAGDSVQVHGYGGSSAQSYPQLSLSILGAAPGEYAVGTNAGEATSFASYYFNAQSVYSTTESAEPEGTLVVTEIAAEAGGVVKGTFEFTDHDSGGAAKTVTNGRFHVVFPD